MILDVTWKEGEDSVAMGDVLSTASREVFENVVNIVGAASRLAAGYQDVVVGAGTREVGREIDIKYFGV